MQSFYTKNNFLFLYALLALVYISGLFIPVMENDSAQHAVMAMRMYLNDNFFDFYRGSEPYLDKPHLHFWLATISYKLFGLTEWAYRLPALLFTILGAYSCFHLAKDLYSKQSGHLASLIFLSSQAIILSNHDVRTDAVLTGATIFSIWQLFKYIKTQKLLPIILGAVGMGLSFSTKGMYGVAIIGLSLICHILYTKSYKVIFSYKIIIAFIVLLITISPILYAYYVQFGIDGVEFILWKQNFNRITATGLVESNPDHFFFFHTLLWVFFPWSLLMYFGLFSQLKSWISNKFKQQDNVEFLTIGGVIITLIIMSFSKFKLPHYLNPLIALLAIFLSGYLVRIENKRKTLRTFLYILYFFSLILTLGITLLLGFTFNTPSYYIIISAIAIFIFLVIAIKSKQKDQIKLIGVSVILMCLVNFNLTNYFYPNLLQYQGGLNISKVIKEEQINLDEVYILKERYSWSLDFYTNRNTPQITLDELRLINKPVWVFVDKEVLFDEIQDNFKINKYHKTNHFRVTKLSMKFLNPKTRDSKVGKAYLINVLP